MLNKNENRVMETLKKCTGLIKEFDKKYIKIIFIYSVFSGVTPSILILLRKKIINNIQLKSLDIRNYIIIIALFILVKIILIIVDYYFNIYDIKFNSYFGNYIKLKTINKSMDLKLSDFEDSSTHDTISRAKTQNGENITSFYSNFFLLIKIIIKMTTSILLIVNFNIWLLPIIAILPIIRYIYLLKYNKIRYQFQLRTSYQNRILWYIDYLFLTGFGYKEIKIFNSGSYLINKYNTISKKVIEENNTIIKHSSVRYTIISIMDQVISGGVFCFFVSLGYFGKLLIGDVITYTDLVLSLRTDLETSFAQLTKISNDTLHLQFLLEFLKLDGDTSESNNDKIELKCIDTIEMVNVSFKYPNAKSYSLKDINLLIDKKVIFGIIGKNGSGKTTLAKILLGFYRNYEGDIFINNINLNKIKPSSYKKLVACVFQDYIKYEFSLRENIGLGDVNDIENDSKIEKTLKLVDTTNNIINNFSFKTYLGAWFGSNNISTGEWQRLAIARSLYKEADFYILDEPDSSLDVEGESKMLDLYKNSMSNKICLFITHNIKQTKYISDNIIVMDKGSIVEYGSHEELMNNKSLYYSLYSKEL